VSFAISSIHAISIAFFVGGFGEVEVTVALIVRTSRRKEWLAQGEKNCARDAYHAADPLTSQKSGGQAASLSA
jgi:hypothetical protein